MPTFFESLGVGVANDGLDWGWEAKSDVYHKTFTRVSVRRPPPRHKSGRSPTIHHQTLQRLSSDVLAIANARSNAMHLQLCT